MRYAGVPAQGGLHVDYVAAHLGRRIHPVGQYSHAAHIEIAVEIDYPGAVIQVLYRYIDSSLGEHTHESDEFITLGNGLGQVAFVGGRKV